MPHHQIKQVEEVLPSSLLLFLDRLLVWVFHVHGDEVGREESFAAVVAALPPVVGAGRHRSEHEFLNSFNEGQEEEEKT